MSNEPATKKKAYPEIKTKVGGLCSIVIQIIPAITSSWACISYIFSSFRVA
jgi:hypothetical protein